MKKLFKDRTRVVYFIITILCPVVYILINMGRTSGLFFPPDEIGYWENVARMLGLDWSGSVFMQSYYANGYSILLFPIAVTFSSPLSMYKAAIFVNSLLFGAQALILPCLLKELAPDIESIEKYLICLAGAFYPAHFVYMNYTIAESMLSFFVILTFLFLARYENTGRGIYAFMTVMAASVLVYIHYRMIGVFLAAVGLIMVRIAGNKFSENTFRRIMLSVGILAVVAFLTLTVIALSSYRSGFSYVDAQLDRLARLFTAEGAADIVMGIVGKLYYIAVASFALVFLCIRRIIGKRRESMTGVAFLIALMISVVIAAVFFVGGKGIDYLVYGRYSEVFAPIIVILGLEDLCHPGDKSSYNRKFGTLCSSVVAFSALILVVYAMHRGINVYMRDFIIGISWMFGKTMPMVNQLIGIPAMVCIIFLWLYIWIISGENAHRRSKIITGIITVLFTSIAVYMSESCVYHYHEIDRSDVGLFETVTKMYDSGHKVDFLRPPGVNYIGHLQFYMFDRTINYIDGPDPEAFTTGPDDYVVTYANYEFRDMLAAKYDSVLESAHFIVYHN